ncbi:MAG: response regulator [Actinomycetota bacterium]|nr:response regulator [Actinomycetota bacterium]
MSNGIVLIVDDTKFIRLLASTALKPLGCTVIEAENGAMALDLIEEHHPDVVLLDVVMPEIDGFQTLAHIRSTPGMENTQVAMLTTAGMPSDLELGAEMGADAYILKPFDNDGLRAKVAELLELATD